MNSYFNKFVDVLISVLGLGADVVTVTSGSAGNAGSTAAELITYMSARLLEVAEYNTILDQFGKLIAELQTCSEHHGNPSLGNQMQADEDKLPILAGFFAGEGCIGIRKSSKKSKSPSLVVELGNTEKCWVDLFQDFFGGYTRVYFPKRYKGSLPYYHWTLKDEKAGVFLYRIFPFLLGEKRPQAILGLQLAAIKASRPNRGKRGKSGHFSQEEIEVMGRLEAKLRNLRRAAAETKRTSGKPSRNDSPTLQAIVD